MDLYLLQASERLVAAEVAAELHKQYVVQEAVEMEQLQMLQVQLLEKPIQQAKLLVVAEDLLQVIQLLLYIQEALAAAVMAVFWDQKQVQMEETILEEAAVPDQCHLILEHLMEQVVLEQYK
jgi:hypothetical protein